MYWHLYDYYLDPDASYYAAKKACEPLHIQYSYDNHAIVVVNSTYQQVDSMQASITVHDVQWNELYSAKAEVDAPPDSSQAPITLPATLFSGTHRIFLIDLKLSNADGKVVSHNFYWVPYRLTDFDWTATYYTYTPAKFYPDLSALTHLPQATVAAHAEVVQTPHGKKIRLQLTNTSNALAFQVRFVLRTPSGGLIAPVIWSDDWIELTPRESRTLTTATLPNDTPSNAVVKLSGWNIQQATITPAPSTSGTASQQ